ncbi:glycosyltransferase family 2 protein [Deinococcus cellulosilyticus]|uniref:Glycosyl transferase family 2 n=1 Tax=Deinococcus cellulosilyticus (strain DSM 18568 / NBRC 106333 / KACC 11606 / 5516J-15) TaxID=1223518 RepID=A0A511N9V1_DEIC1|nr:glycosyltransferase [Deinococcus cellulosilyticus]GEM49609.1 glycosyl transferase family 2 [Deinococcus cellulosilyticus NBRC 106333 = KACC 11606]
MTLLNILEVLILVYFAVLNSIYAVSVLVASRVMVLQARRGERVILKTYLEREYYKPISVLVPGYNEEPTIAASVHSFLNLQYPEFEVIVINDGSKDKTMEVLIEEFQLEPTIEYPSRVLPTQEVRGLYRSPKHPNLLVIDKANGGKADALNAGIIYATKPLFCAVDADSLLEAEALLRVARQFLEDDSLVAVGGTIRVLNGADFQGDVVETLHAPRTWMERIQVVEYTRAFLAGRSTFSELGVLLIISGAFGLFSRRAVLDVGGYRTDTVGEDMELVVRLHRQMREKKMPYSVRYMMDPIAWTQVPNDWGTLKRQRNRWHRGLMETLWRHRVMFFNPRYGRIGFFSMPFYLFFEAMAPLIEVFGYVFMLYLTVTGQLNMVFAIGFLVMALLYGVLVSVASLGIEGFMVKRYASQKDRARIMMATLVEQVGYRQILAWERVKAFVDLYRKKGQWGSMTRQKITR